MKDFHCCATCSHFNAERKSDSMIYYCSRLGFETKTNYKFNCWSPKKSIIDLMDKLKKS
jgi:hypothetical protein